MPSPSRVAQSSDAEIEKALYKPQSSAPAHRKVSSSPPVAVRCLPLPFPLLLRMKHQQLSAMYQCINVSINHHLTEPQWPVLPVCLFFGPPSVAGCPLPVGHWGREVVAVNMYSVRCNTMAWAWVPFAPRPRLSLLTSQPCDSGCSRSRIQPCLCMCDSSAHAGGQWAMGNG